MTATHAALPSLADDPRVTAAHDAVTEAARAENELTAARAAITARLSLIPTGGITDAEVRSALAERERLDGELRVARHEATEAHRALLAVEATVGREVNDAALPAYRVLLARAAKLVEELGQLEVEELDFRRRLDERSAGAHFAQASPLTPFVLVDRDERRNTTAAARWLARARDILNGGAP